MFHHQKNTESPDKSDHCRFSAAFLREASIYSHGQLVLCESHVTTDGQPVSPSWCRAPSGAHDQMLRTVRQLLFCQCRGPPLTRGRVCHLSLS
jgi:hypothetical protein